VKQRLLYAVLATLAVATPAAAQSQRLAQNFAYDALPPYEVVTIIRSAGLDPLGPPVRRGPRYVLRAVSGDDREVRVVVDARSGGILSVTPVMTASRTPPPGTTYGRYERMPPGYLPDDLPRAYRPAPPAIYDDEPPVVYGARPPAGLPGAPPPRGAEQPPVITALPPGDLAAVDNPDIATEPGRRSGLLPPPPERFPQRTPPVGAKPKSAKRVVATIPRQAPLPRPRPQAEAAVPPTPSGSEPPASPEAPASPDSGTDTSQLPH
jgi:hypothetical protein